ncbi:hypothetical protein VTO73DRAFT_13384 [Trametes versicolor]
MNIPAARLLLRLLSFTNFPPLWQSHVCALRWSFDQVGGSHPDPVRCIHRPHLPKRRTRTRAFLRICTPVPAISSPTAKSPRSVSPGAPGYKNGSGCGEPRHRHRSRRSTSDLGSPRPPSLALSSSFALDFSFS